MYFSGLALFSWSPFINLDQMNAIRTTSTHQNNVQQGSAHIICDTVHMPAILCLPYLSINQCNVCGKAIFCMIADT